MLTGATLVALSESAQADTVSASEDVPGESSSANTRSGPIIMNFDENGNASCNLGPCTASVGPDPTHLVSGNVLIYSLPVTVGAGTIGINNASGQLSDVLRFTNANGAVSGAVADEMIFYSFDDFGSLADVGSVPPFFVTTVFATEDAGGSFSFRPIPASPTTDQYNGLSDVPAPAALPLFATGLGALGLLGRRRKRQRASSGLNIQR